MFRMGVHFLHMHCNIMTVWEVVKVDSELILEGIMVL